MCPDLGRWVWIPSSVLTVVMGPPKLTESPLLPVGLHDGGRQRWRAKGRRGSPECSGGHGGRRGGTGRRGGVGAGAGRGGCCGSWTQGSSMEGEGRRAGCDPWPCADHRYGAVGGCRGVLHRA